MVNKPTFRCTPQRLLHGGLASAQDGCGAENAFYGRVPPRLSAVVSCPCSPGLLYVEECGDIRPYYGDDFPVGVGTGHRFFHRGGFHGGFHCGFRSAGIRSFRGAGFRGFRGAGFRGGAFHGGADIADKQRC